MFQRFSASLVPVGDVQDVSRRHAVRGKKSTHCVLFWGVEKVESASGGSLIELKKLDQKFKLRNLYFYQ